MNTTTFLRAPSAALMMVLLAAGAFALAGCDKRTSSEATSAAGSASGVTAANLAEKIEQARSPADHRELAAYYDARAEAAQREVAEDRELRGRYERRWQPDNHPMGPGARGHYDNLIGGHEASAHNYQAMAQWHREMAGRAQESSTADE